MIGEDDIENGIDTIETIEPSLSEINVDESVTPDELDDEQSLSRDIGIITIPMLFPHITRESVSTLTGIEGSKMFKAMFEMLKPKAESWHIGMEKKIY